MLRVSNDINNFTEVQWTAIEAYTSNNYAVTQALFSTFENFFSMLTNLQDQTLSDVWYGFPFRQNKQAQQNLTAWNYPHYKVKQLLSIIGTAFLDNRALNYEEMQALYENVKYGST